MGAQDGNVRTAGGGGGEGAECRYVGKNVRGSNRTRTLETLRKQRLRVSFGTHAALKLD